MARDERSTVHILVPRERLNMESVCEDCDGTGTIDCGECGSELTCENCDGTGEVADDDDAS